MQRVRVRRNVCRPSRRCPVSLLVYYRGRRAHGGYDRHHNHGRVPVANRRIVAETYADGQTIADKSSVRPFELSPGRAPFGRHPYSRHAQTAAESKRVFGKRGLCPRIPKRDAVRYATKSRNPPEPSSSSANAVNVRSINYVREIFHVKSPDVLV